MILAWNQELGKGNGSSLLKSRQFHRSTESNGCLSFDSFRRREIGSCGRRNQCREPIITIFCYRYQGRESGGILGSAIHIHRKAASQKVGYPNVVTVLYDSSTVFMGGSSTPKTTREPSFRLPELSQPT
jgi:hypothetical protein